MNRLELIEYLADPSSGSWDEVGYRPFPMGRPDPVPTAGAANDNRGSGR